MLIAILFCTPPDVQSVLNSETYYPFMNIYEYAVGSKAGATGMVSSADATRRDFSSHFAITLAHGRFFVGSTRSVLFRDRG